MTHVPVTPAKAGAYKLDLNQISTDITPQRIPFLNGVDFPFALPGFHGLLAHDCVSDIIENLEIDERFGAIFFSEAVDQPLSMLKTATDQIAGNANVQRAVSFTGHDVDISTFSHQFNPKDLCVWMPAYAGMTGKESEARHG